MGFIIKCVYVVVHMVPMLDGEVRVTSEDFGSREGCEFRAMMLNKIDPSDFNYKCEVKSGET